MSPSTTVGFADFPSPFRRGRVRALVVLVVMSLLSIGGTAAVNATRADGLPFQLVVSARADRAGPVPLAGATVTGRVFAFVSPAAGVDEVRFHVDDVEQRKPPTQVEHDAPFDLGGTRWAPSVADQLALPFDTARLVPGDHSVTAVVVLDDGSATVLRARFRVEPGPVAATTTTGASPAAPPATPATTVAAPVASTTAPSTTTAAPPTSTGGIAGSLRRGILFGLGPDASTSRGSRLVREAPVGLLTSWYHGPDDLAWMTGWRTTLVPQTYATGRALHLIVWSGGPEGPLSTAYGPACGRAYPLSDRFLGDMERLATTFAGPAGGPPLYVTLFTEFQTFPCVDSQWGVDAATTSYYRALKDRYRDAYAVFHRLAPNAQVSLGWGGWQARDDAPETGGGRSLFAHFDDVLRLSDFQSFQAVASESAVTDVRAMTGALGGYGPVMLAHYKPDPRSPAARAADLRAMLSDAVVDELLAAGLFAFSFLDESDLVADEELYQLAAAAIHRRGVLP